MIEPLDYEASHEYYITIEATDGGTPPLSDIATVNVNLTDVNDNRPIFSQDVYTAVVGEDAELGRAVITVRHGRAAAIHVPPFIPLHATAAQTLFTALTAHTYHVSAPVESHHLEAQPN